MKFETINSDDVFSLKFIDPEKLKFFCAGDVLRVTIEGDRSCLRVLPMSAFPLSMRDRYISLRDMDGNELGMIKDTTKLDKNSQKLLARELHKRYFMPVIYKIKSLNEKLAVFEWEVETDRGAKKFYTRRLHNSLKEKDKGFIITDLENNRYEIHDYSELDPQSKSILGKSI